MSKKIIRCCSTCGRDTQGIICSRCRSNSTYLDDIDDNTNRKTVAKDTREFMLIELMNRSDNDGWAYDDFDDEE
jgi:hypothetical protein